MLADNRRRASPLGLDILGAPGLYQVVVVLAAQLLLRSGSAVDGSGLAHSTYPYVDVVAHVKRLVISSRQGGKSVKITQGEMVD